MRKKEKYIISYVRCPECGKHMFVPRSMRRRRKIGHIKTMFCPFCEENRDFIEEID